MIDPIQSLAFSIQANPGVYAVLIGSGVSRAAKISTGWEITLDLIRKLARLHGETSDPDPASWYLEKFGKEPDYSELLDAIVKTQAERQQLLRPYFEPNAAEREKGEKEPTAAHRAIAALAAKGFIKVIIITNFDRLMETALKDAGVEPTVLSSPDQVKGTLPLIHTQCCVFKVHGDYLDTRIRNTPDELDKYPPEFDQLLDRIFDEFGLIVCGWSAEWDGALRSAIYRAKSHRFTTYWTVRGKPGDKAQNLIEHRRAEVIPIADADTFFQTIQQHVESIETFSMPHPLSTEAAVVRLKSYLAEPRYRIQLSDLIKETVERIMEVTSSEAFSIQDNTQPTTESARTRLRNYEAACETLMAMALIGGYWAEEEHYPVWQRALLRLGSRTLSHSYALWRDLQRYPATLLLYALGLGAVEANRLQFLNFLLSTTLHREYREDAPAVQILPPCCLFEYDEEVRTLKGTDGGYAPLNTWMHNALQPYAESIIPDTNRYTLAFDKLEILIALNFAHQRCFQDRYWVPPGVFGYRQENRELIFREIAESLSTAQAESPFVTSGIFGETAENCGQGLRALTQYVNQLGWW